MSYPEYDFVAFRPTPRAVKRWMVTAKFSRRGGQEAIAYTNNDTAAAKITEALRLLAEKENE